MKKLLRWTAGAALALPLLAGCSAPNGSVAAIVNDVAIPESRVTAFAEGCSAALTAVPQLSQSPAQLRSQMVKWAVLDEMSRQQAEKTGDGPTDQEVRDYVGSTDLTILFSNEDCGRATMGVARHDLTALSLGDDMADYFNSYKVELNPRYGQWDPQTLNNVGTGSLSTEAGA